MIALMVFTALLVYLGIAWLVIKRLPSKKAKWIAVAIFILVPTWDEILGRIYFKHLCETEGGVKVLKMVKLGPEYWDANGRPKFIKENGDPDETLFGSRFILTKKWERDYSKSFNIAKQSYAVLAKQTQEPLATYTFFAYFGGWLTNHASIHVVGEPCHELRIGFFEDFLQYVIKPNSEGR